MPWAGRLAISFFDELMPLREGAMPIDKVAQTEEIIDCWLAILVE